MKNSTTALSDAGEALTVMSQTQRETMASDIFDPITVGYLDFGSVGILDRDTRERLASFLLAISGDAALGALQNQVGSMMSFAMRLPNRLEKMASDLEGGSFGKRFRPFANAEDRSFLPSLEYDALGAILTIAAVFGAIVLIASDSGPLMTPPIRFHTFLAYVLAFFGFILTMRTILRVFLNRNQRR